MTTNFGAKIQKKHQIIAFLNNYTYICPKKTFTINLKL